MKTLLTTISSGYVQKWGVKEGLRELMQNAIDAKNKGCEMIVKYDLELEILEIISVGARLQMSDFLLGSSIKSGDETQIGEYGEGYKIGTLALLRENMFVEIENQIEGSRFIGKITRDITYDSDVLAFDMDTNAVQGDKLIFRVHGIPQIMWDEYQNFYRDSEKELTETMKCDRGYILMDTKYQGQLFVGGLFVCKSAEMKYGYDFNPRFMKLDRDRGILDSWDVRWSTSQMWASQQEERSGLIYKMLNEEKPDVDMYSNFTNKEGIDKLICIFAPEGITGRRYPVSTQDEFDTMKSIGYNPVLQNSKMTEVLRKNMGDFEDLINESKFNFDTFTMSDNQAIIVEWAISKIKEIDNDFSKCVNIVEFHNIATMSYLHEDTIRISLSLADDRIDVLGEIVVWFSRENFVDPLDTWKKLFAMCVRD
jgi:hypothetical protein